MNNYFTNVALGAGSAATMCVLSSSASAQHFPFEQHSDQRVSVGITVPLGGRRSHPDDNAPRVEIITSRRDGQDDYDGAILRPDVERRVGLSLTKNTRFYVDGRAVDLNGDNQRAGISDTVLIVGVVVLVGVVVAVASNFNDLSFDQD